MRTRLSRWTLFVAVGAVLATGCSGTAGPVAATVDGAEIPRSELEAAVSGILERDAAVDDLDAQARAARTEALQRQVLTLLIQAKVIEGVVRDRGVDIDLDEVHAAFDAEVEEAGGPDEFAQLLVGSELTMTLLRDVLLPAQRRVQALREQLLEGHGDLEERTTRHILVETAEEADALVAELNEGADFAELAREHSIDPGSGAAGGDLGTAARGAYVPEFEDAVWSASIGTIVGPIESAFGFHIIEVTAEETTSVADLATEQADQLVGAELGALLDAAFAAAEVEIAAGLGEWDPLAGGVVPAAQVGSGGTP